MKSHTPAKPRLRPEHRRTLLEREALRLFGRRGYAATRLEDVAAAAGVTKPMVYRHFASKKDLYLALLRRHEADLPTFMEGTDLTATGGSTAFELVIDGWFDYVEENKDSWLVLFRDKTGDPDIEEARMSVSRRATEVIAAFIAQSAPDFDPAVLEPTAELVRAGLAGLVLWWIDHPDVERETVHATATRAWAAVLG